MASLIFWTTDARHSRWHFYSSITTGINGKNRRKHNDFYYLSQYNVRNSIAQSLFFLLPFLFLHRELCENGTINTQSFHFLWVLMFLCSAYPVCVFTVPIFSLSLSIPLSLFLTCSRCSIQKPIICVHYTLAECIRRSIQVRV